MRKIARKLVGWAAAATLNLTTLQAAAADVETKQTRWYGWQTLAVDAAATTTMIVGVTTAPRVEHGAGSLVLGARLLGDGAPNSSATLDVGLAMYTLGPAVVHALHGRPLPSVGSAAMRSVGPTAGVFVGLAYGVVLAIPVAIIAPGKMHSGYLDFGSNGNAVILGGIVSGAVLGAVGPMVIDAVALAHEPVADSSAPPAKPDAAKVTWSPQASWSKGGPTVGLSGTF